MEPYKYQGASTTSDPNASFWLGLATHEVGHQVFIFFLLMKRKFPQYIYFFFQILKSMDVHIHLIQK